MRVVVCVVLLVVVFNFVCGQEDVETGDNLQYQFFPVVGSSLQFKVRAHNDAHIALSLHPTETDPLYEVVIGGWANKKSVIRKRVCSFHEKDAKPTPQYLSEDMFRGFWVHWDSGIVSVGREGETNAFLSWRDNEPFSIAAAGVHTGFGSKGVWKLQNASSEDINVRNEDGHDQLEVKTEDSTKYQFFPVSDNMLRFKVRAGSDAHIALSSHPWESGPMYEIIIGGWANSKSAIRRRYCEQQEKDGLPTPQVLNKDEYRGFWMKWDNGIVQVGKTGDASPFLSWHDPDPFKVAYVGVHTGFGSTGTWKIDNVPSDPSNIDNDVFTEDNVQYQFFPVYGTSTKFKVHARNDAHIALASIPRESGPMYEIVIGGWSNTKSVIRRRTCFPWEREEVQTPNILGGSEYRGFWVRWESATILVGRQGEAKPFMTWLDLEPLPVSYFGVHTGFGAAGLWEIDNLQSGDGRKSLLSTGDNTEYQFFQITGRSVTFKVRANNDVHVGLFSEPRETDPMYEIVIGGWGNTKSVIRKKYCHQKVEKDEVSTPNYLNEYQYRGFWVRWKNGKISVGQEGSSRPFMSWDDLNPLRVTHMGLHTGFGSTGIWKVTNESRNNAEEHIVTGDNIQYQYYPISSTSLHFKVRARNDVHVGLTSGPQDSDPMYEIVIGGWANSKSVIRKRCCLPPERDEVQTPEILDDAGFRTFWMSWDKGNVMAGREGETSPFLKWQDPNPFPVSYLGVHTGFGSSGTWKLGSSTIDDRVSHKPVVIPLVLPAETPAPVVCAPTQTRLFTGTACAGQVVFEENFDALREEVWQVQQYVPIDHPELPFVSYQRFTVSVKNGYLRITPALQQVQPGFTYYSLYGSLDLYNGCTSGQSSSCHIEASDDSSILPPVVGGRVTSKSSFAFTYGIISVRAKLPQGDWIYPEILLEPLLKKFVYGTKNSGMLKIACARGNLDLTKGSTQFGNKVLYSGPVIDTKCHNALFINKASNKYWGDDFHVYSVKWTPESLIMSVDGEEYGRIEPGRDGLRASLPKICAGPQQSGMAPFDDHFYITLGLAVGGHTEFPDACVSKDHKKPWKDRASKATLNFWNDIDTWHDTWELPKLLVDYVKVVAL
ncbi:uncharacterized protein LOC133520493 [Cydia pomonella]|uniref:uncharacterized protein LOC133520493 n=1 Tax=Cydia pomonella TaxID=82600 RepID=UPI002ADD483C|nr:uncharacterized protein LOC133520493 [Cydia pomonella]